MELKKILYKRKIVFFIIAFFLFHIGFFIYSQQSSKEQFSEISRYEIDCCKEEIINEYKENAKDINEIDLELNTRMAQLQILLSSSAEMPSESLYLNKYSLSTYSCAMEEVISQLSYVETFQSSVDKVLNQAESMNVISIFSNQDSFSTKNIEKTKKDYTNIKNVKPVFFSTSFLENFFTYTPANYIAIFCGFVFAMSLCEEKKRGLKSLIFSTYSGRGRLAASKLSALFLLTMGTTLLLYVTTLFVSMLLYQKELNLECFSYPVQSLELFSSFPNAISIGIFLLLYIVVRCLIVFVTALLFLFLLSLFETTMVSFGIMAVILTGEYLLYILIRSNSPVNLLKYVNLFYCFHGADIFTEYKNLDLFSHAIEKNMCIIFAGSVLMLLLLILSFLVNRYKYPVSTPDKISQVAKSFLKPFSKLYYNITEGLSLKGMEFYKILFCQKGIFVLLVLFVIMGYDSDFSKVSFSATQELMMDFLEKYEGVPGEESETYIKEMDIMVHELEKEYGQAVQEYEKGDIDAEEFLTATIKYDSFAPERTLIEQLKTKREYLKNLKNEKNINGWYLNEYGYIHLIGDGKDESTHAALLAIGIVLLCSGVFAFERKSETKNMLRATEWGRNFLFKKKIQTAFGIAFFLFLVMTVFEFVTVLYVYGLSGFTAPVQSLQFLSFIPIRCNIGIFVTCVYILKLFMMMTMAGFTCMLSTIFSQKGTILLSALLFVPTFLYLAGIKVFQYFSIVNVFRITPLLLGSQNVWISSCVVLVFVAVGIMSTLAARKRWCKN